jgi:hypothetical protein
MKIYLAGPMRGHPNFNFPAFDMAAVRLRAQGHEVFSPADHDRKNVPAAALMNETGDEDQLARESHYTINDALAADTAWICRHAQAVALLPGWEKSTGAQAERALGVALGLTIIILGKEYTHV